MKLRQNGVTLLEMLFVIALISVISILSFYDKQTDFEQSRARQVGSYIYQYNNAVRSALAQGLVPSTTTYLGASWLKNSTCGGVLPVGSELLPCHFPVATAADPIPYGNLSFSTAVVVTGTAPNKKYVATTMTPPFTVKSGDVRADLAGIATMSAAAALGTGIQSGGSGGLSLFSATTDASYQSDPSTGRITFVSSNTANNDVWLRADGGNKMHATVNFDAASELDRMIVGASKIQNFAGQALFLGAGSGMTAMTAAIVVMDGNAEVLGDFRIRNHMQVDGRINVLGNAIVNGNINASGEIVSNSYIHASSYVYGQLFMDTNDGNYYVDPNAVSHMNVIYARSIGDKDNGAYYLDPNSNSRVYGMLADYSYASVFYDINNTGYYVQPSFTSRLNVVASNTIVNYGRVTIGEYLQLDGVANEGWGCAPNGLVGRNPAGAVVSCQSGVWKAGSASLGGTWQQVNGDQQGWIPLECPAGYVMTGITAPNEDWKSIRCRQLQ